MIHTPETTYRAIQRQHALPRKIWKANSDSGQLPITICALSTHAIFLFVFDQN